MFGVLAGRSETEIEYDVGFNDEGRISALSIRGWWLAGADIDLGWNDMMIIKAGADQVQFIGWLKVFYENGKYTHLSWYCHKLLASLCRLYPEQADHLLIACSKVT